MGGLLFNPSLSLLDWDTIATSFDVYDLDSLQTGKEPRESGAGNVEDAQATLNSTQHHTSNSMDVRMHLVASTSETTMEQRTNENLVSFPD